MKHNTIKKKLFSTGSPKVSSSIHLDGPKFQTLAPQTPNGPSFVRVQNSQVHLIFKYGSLFVGSEFVSCHEGRLECSVKVQKLIHNMLLRISGIIEFILMRNA
jgi:hypothetical protein